MKTRTNSEVKIARLSNSINHLMITGEQFGFCTISEWLEYEFALF